MIVIIRAVYIRKPSNMTLMFLPSILGAVELLFVLNIKEVLCSIKRLYIKKDMIIGNILWNIKMNVL